MIIFLKPKKINTIWFKGLQKVPEIEVGEMVQPVRRWGDQGSSGENTGPSLAKFTSFNFSEGPCLKVPYQVAVLKVK